jgi:chromosome segregation ATPase
MNIIKYCTNWKYRYFTRELQALERRIAKTEFQIFGIKKTKEQERVEYEAIRMKLEQLDAKIKGTKDPKVVELEQRLADITAQAPQDANLSNYQPVIDAKKAVQDAKSDEFKRMEDEVVRLVDENESHKLEMDKAELTVYGSRPTNEHRDGVVGLYDVISQDRILALTIREYMNNL